MFKNLVFFGNCWDVLYMVGANTEGLSRNFSSTRVCLVFPLTKYMQSFNYRYRESFKAGTLSKLAF